MVKYYLIAYNLLLFLAWTAYFAYALVTGFSWDGTALLLLNIAQGAAILEVLHAALKWVKSPIFTTFIQVFSRLFVLVLVNLVLMEYYAGYGFLIGCVLISIAWSVTEIIRYSYYATNLIGNELKFLSFLRYTLFIGLYPTGVIGEFLVVLSFIAMRGWTFEPLHILLYLILASYFYFFPQLYGYMWKQRKKKLG